jgi:hypothetical protein
MVTLFGVGFVLMALVAGALLVYVLYLLFYEKEEDPKDSTIVRNTFTSQYTNGHAEFVVDEFIKGTSRIGLKLIPKDLPYLKYFKKGRYKKPKIEPILLWYPRHKIHDLSRPSSSVYKNIIELEPLSAFDINPNVKETALGKMWAFLLTENNLEQSRKDFVEHELMKTQDIIKSPWVGELSPGMLDKLNIVAEDRAKMATTSKEERRGYIPPDSSRI